MGWLQHARLPCPSPSPRICSNSCHWVSDTIQPSHPVIPFSSCRQSFPASMSFPVSWLFTLGGQTTGSSSSVSVLPMNIQGWFPLGLTGLISLQSGWLSRVFSSTTVWKHQFFGTWPSLWFGSHIHTSLLEKPSLWLDRLLLPKWCLCFLIHCPGLLELSFQGASMF